jgi:hypothetical protein
VFGSVWPGGVVVPELVVCQAPPQAAEELVGQVPQRGVVMIASRAATVVVFARARGFGEHRECPPVTRVAEAFVADLAGLDVARASGRDRHRRGAGERAQTVRIGESCRVITALAENTGGEDWGEVSELQRRDFNDDCSAVTVARAVRHRQGCHVDTPKDGKAAKVVIPPHIRADIKEHLANHVDNKPDSLLFVPSRGGCHVNDRVFSKDVFQPACDALGLSGLTHHSLRHFAGTQTARVGNLPETMARLRHTTHKASLLYQQQVSGRDIAVAEALSALRMEAVAAN